MAGKRFTPTRLTGRVLLFVAVLSGVVVGGACSNVPPQVPTGDPLEVVSGSPERTIEGGRVTVFVAAPSESLEAELDLSSSLGPANVRKHALRALKEVRTANAARPYGGQQVRGAPTMRYEVTTRNGGRFDLWIDVEGRVRRALLPDGPLTSSPPSIQPNGLPALVTIDFVFEPRRQVAPGGPAL